MDANDLGMLQLFATCVLAVIVVAVFEFRLAVA
jgi:hypothetical protein